MDIAVLRTAWFWLELDFFSVDHVLEISATIQLLYLLWYCIILRHRCYHCNCCPFERHSFFPFVRTRIPDEWVITLQIDVATTAARWAGKECIPDEERGLFPRCEDCGRDQVELHDVRPHTWGERSICYLWLSQCDGPREHHYGSYGTNDPFFNEENEHRLSGNVCWSTTCYQLSKRMLHF